jgi:hypothetical protein
MSGPISPDSEGSAGRRQVLTYVLCALAAALVVGLWRQLPHLNGPEEWQWAYRPPSLRFLPGVVALAAACAILLGSAKQRVDRWLIAALTVAGTILSIAVGFAVPGGVDQVMGGLASRDTFGFAWDAGLAPGTSELLADYPAASASLNQHSLTHPPGPLLLVRAADLAVKAFSPDPDDAVNGEGLRAAAARALAHERSRARGHGRPIPSHLPLGGTLVLIALALPLCSSLTAIPLAALARSLGLEPPVALLAAALWLAVPARSVFTPSFDQALPLLVITASWLAVQRGWFSAVGAGVLVWCSLFMSYGCLVLAPLPVLLALGPHGEGARSSTEGIGPSWRFARGAVIVGAGALMAIVVWLLTGFEPVRAMRTALGLHHHIAVESRSYALWLLGNPYDFALLLGPPLFGVGLFGWWSKRTVMRLKLLGAGVAALLVVTWLSGNVRGEVGRIWLLWMPLLCLLAAPAIDRGGRSSRALVVATELGLLATLAANLTFLS